MVSLKGAGKWMGGQNGDLKGGERVEFQNRGAKYGGLRGAKMGWRRNSGGVSKVGGPKGRVSKGGVPFEGLVLGAAGPIPAVPTRGHQGAPGVGPMGGVPDFWG